MEGPLIDALYPENYFKNETEEGSVTVFNRIIGNVQLRQIRMKENTCTPQAPVNDVTCFDPNYEEDKEDFGPNGTYKYVDDGLARFYSRYGPPTEHFGSGGFIEDLGRDRSSALNKIEELKTNGWMDEKTRVVTATINVYNPNVDRFGVVLAVLEFPPSRGTFIPYANVKSFPYNFGDGWLILLQILILIYFIFEFPANELDEVCLKGF